MGRILPFLILLLVIAAFVQDDFIFTLIYLTVGSYAIGSWWSQRGLAGVKFRRQYTDRVFLGEKITVGLRIENSSWLPIPWVQLHEGLPVELSGPGSFQRVVSLGPRAVVTLDYHLDARKRGYYPIGPLFLSSGDIFGIVEGDLRREGPLEHLTVYPKIVPLTNVRFPAMSPMGTLRHNQPIFEDPTRVFGKRDYVAGDSLRRVDWKATAATGTLQVRQYEPSIALEIFIFLNLNVDEYHYRSRFDATELAIITAASIANWVVDRRQSVGLYVNGKDELSIDGKSQSLPPRKGQSHLMRILEILARIQMDECAPLVNIIQQERVRLPWGTTMLVITGRVNDMLLDELYQARRGGLSVYLILCGPVAGSRDIINRAAHFGIQVAQIERERDLDIWRQ